ncbi:MAG: Asp-tRNA(Asn)/Glu-tRNA(Gln) amidotransferase GatCAB subunit A [Planctomycetota bacterium]|nr:MAG: Asp-tRNA(Asn)/Glu-tRNA(Gln) amidotransferase GatCAB subunit A [Planctomycetota bacterium]
MTVCQLLEAIRQGSISVVEAVEQCLERIRRWDGDLGAFLSVAEEEALKQAQELDNLPEDKRGVLFGLPIAVKDNILVKGLTATAGSKILENFIAPYDATAVKRLVSAGAVVLGKTNLDEFAMGSSCEHSAFFVTRNPWDRERVPGGSSGGSAAAVAARLVPAALGSDTGGSVRQPASFCGVTGHRPTYGLVSRYGLIAFASSLDTIGPIAQTAEDCLLLLSVMAGPDANDATTAPHKVDLQRKPFQRWRIGVVRNALEAAESAVAEALEETARVFQNNGCVLKDVDAGALEDALAAYHIIATAEASANLARYSGVHFAQRRDEGELALQTIRKTRALFGTEVKRRILLGTYVLSAGYYNAYYLRAVAHRRALRAKFLSILRDIDMLLLPTTPSVAFRFGEKLKDPLKMYAADVMTVGVSLAGLPAVSFPCGFVEGLPVGAQLVGRPFEDALVLSAAAWFQKQTDYHKRVPTGFEA